MASRHSSINHFGVEVAPQMPTDETPSNQCGEIALGLSTMYVRGFTLRQASNKTFPLLLLRPQANMMMS